MIILLDLNYTLVENSREKKSPFIKQITNERYREWLIDLIRDYHVILVTARPRKYESDTLRSIKLKTGWLPDEWYFNTGFPPATFKEKALVGQIYPRHGNDNEQYLAIESNPKTKAMYSSYGIRAITVEDDKPWETLPL